MTSAVITRPPNGGGIVLTTVATLCPSAAVPKNALRWTDRQAKQGFGRVFGRRAPSKVAQGARERRLGRRWVERHGVDRITAGHLLSGEEHESGSPRSIVVVIDTRIRSGESVSVST